MSDDSTPQYKVAPDGVGEAFSRKMQDMEVAQKEKLAESRAQKLGMPYVSLKNFPIEPEALRMIPVDDAKRLKVIPFNKTDTQLRIGAVNPEQPDVQQYRLNLEEREKIQTELYVITEHSWDIAMPLYSMVPTIREIKDTVTIMPDKLEHFKTLIKTPEDLEKNLYDVPMTDMVTLILAGGVMFGASDVHIEAEEADVKIRYRIDGILVDAAKLEKDLWRRLVTRIKEIARLKINVDTVPQDGHIKIDSPEERIEIRVSTLPTNWGESVVMRLLMESARKLSYDDLGITGKAHKALREEIKRPNGMIVVTGPTGSGKTTTLYAILNELNTEERKIITLENPIEYQVPGLNQTQIDASKNFTFASALRSVLRQDPDVIMVGEIRDPDTVDVAIQAALTGHLMLSTVHTNDAAGALPRLISLDAKPFLLGPALNAIIGQRLVRRFREGAELIPENDAELLERAHKVLAELPDTTEEKKKISKGQPQFFKPKDENAGYKGRVGIFEILIVDSNIERILKGDAVSEVQIRETAREGGMISMVQDGVLKAANKQTSLAEVFRVAEDIE